MLVPLPFMVRPRLPPPEPSAIPAPTDRRVAGAGDDEGLRARDGGGAGDAAGEREAIASVGRERANRGVRCRRSRSRRHRS